MPDPKPYLPLVSTLGVAAAGALLFSLFGLPAPFLTGPAFFVSLAALAGVKTDVPQWLRDLGFLVLGTGIGAGVTPAVVNAALTWPVSFLVLALVLFFTIRVNAWIFVRFFGFSRDEATVAAVPGLLSYTLALAEDRGLNVSRISLVQTLRVLLLTLLVPLLVDMFGGGLGISLPGPGLAGWHLVVLLLLGGVLALLFQRKNIPAAVFLAGFAVSGLGHITTVTPGALPPWLGISAFVVIGALIGNRLDGVRMADLRALALAGVVMTGVSSLIAMLGGGAVAMVLHLAPEALFVSFAPGGLEVMIALAAQLGVDGTFVAAHHIARLMILMALVPVMLRMLK